MKLSQLIESFVISNDEFEDYLDRATEQLAQEVQSGKNARDAVHDLALQFAKQHNSSYDAYTRMSDSLFARLHTLELDGSESTDLVPMDEPMADMGAMNEPEMGDEMTGDMGGMDMNLPADDEMPSDSDMEDYAAVMDNEPEAEEMEESSCGSTHKKKIREAEGEGTYAMVSYDYHDDWGSIELIKDGETVEDWNDYFGANETGNPLAAKFVELCKKHGIDPTDIDILSGDDEDIHPIRGRKMGRFDGKKFKWEDSVSEEDTTMGSIEVKTDEERAGRAALFNLRKIVDEKQARSIKFVDGSTKVDMFTASAIVKVYDAVNAANKAKIINMLGTGKAGLLKVANAAMKLATTNEGVLGGLAKGVANIASNQINKAQQKFGNAGSTTTKGIGDIKKSITPNTKKVGEAVTAKADKIMESAISKAVKSKK